MIARIKEMQVFFFPVENDETPMMLITNKDTVKRCAAKDPNMRNIFMAVLSKPDKIMLNVFSVAA